MILTLKAMGLQRCVFLGPPKLVSSGSFQKGDRKVSNIGAYLSIGEVVLRPLTIRKTLRQWSVYREEQ